MARHVLMATALVAASLAVSAAQARAEHFSAVLSGFQETGPLNAESGAILSEGTATLELDLNRAAQTATFKLTFSGLSSPVTQSHIHFGQVHVPGNVIIFFCSNLGNAPAGTAACPANGGTVTGTLTAAGVIAVPTQNVPAADFDAVEDALESNTAYANIHTTKFPGGELRGQIHLGDSE